MVMTRTGSPSVESIKKYHSSNQQELFDFFHDSYVPPTDSGLFGVAMADGLGSDGEEKSGGYQKIFNIGNNYLLGTGAVDRIQYVAVETLKNPEVTPIELSQKVVDICNDDFEFKGIEGLGFLIVGKNNDKLEVYKIDVPRFRKPIYQKAGYGFDGSGSKFVQKALQRDHERGTSSLSNSYATLADLTLDLYDLGFTATKSTGVNDQFQFGFLTPEGNATLFHPNINIIHPTREYVDENGKLDFEKVNANNNFFWGLMDQFQKSQKATNHCNQTLTYLLSPAKSDVKEVLESIEDYKKKISEFRFTINNLIKGYVAKSNEKV